MIVVNGFKHLILSLVVCLVTTLAVCSTAYASLSAKPVILEFTDGGDNRRDITLLNTGQYTQYIEISPMRITNPGKHPETYLTPKDPERLGLLVAPRRLTLKPGEEKVIRVIRINKPVASDEAWRVHIRPAKTVIEAKKTAIMMQVAYKALVIARPSESQVKLTHARVGKRLEIKNQGNTNVLLHDGKQCQPTDNGNCAQITGKRLWPGDTWVVSLPFDRAVEFQTLSHDGAGLANFQ